jgi:putative methyltransferase (TIGR04325 family)
MRWRRHQGNEFSGPFSAWEQAAAGTTSYADPSILAAVLAAAKVAAADPRFFERDSVLLPAGELQWPVLTALGLAAGASSGSLSVVDFGGSLGSLYFQHREQCRTLGVASWTVVEQEAFAEAGRMDLADGTLDFSTDLASALTDPLPDVAVLSGVLQYLERPSESLDRVLDAQVPVVCVDRTYLTDEGPSIWVQHVPKEIYTASYPCHFLATADIEEAFRSRGYAILARYVNGDFPAIERRGGYFGGFIALAGQPAPADG